jgi:hypothetical protein
MKCYTYYEEIDEINNCPHRESTQKELLDLCKISWERNGWEFVVLNQSSAEINPFFKEYDEVINGLPTVNLKRYEYSCFMRWLAIAQIGGGLMIDYDVINLGFKNQELESDKINVYQNHVPCVVYGTSKQYLLTCKRFCELKEECIQKYEGRPHTSDMLMIASGKIEYNKINLVSDYPKKSVLIHCSQAHCQKNSKTKIDAMRELMDL